MSNYVNVCYIKNGWLILLYHILLLYGLKVAEIMLYRSQQDCTDQQDALEDTTRIQRGLNVETISSFNSWRKRHGFKVRRGLSHGGGRITPPSWKIHFGLAEPNFLHSHLYIYRQLKSKRTSLYLQNSRDEVRPKFGQNLTNALKIRKSKI